MFGDFLNEEKHKLIDFDDVIDLDNGTPVVARYNYREFQFGIYGNGCVIYQDCWITKRMEIVFSLEKSSITDFCEGATVYEYIPNFDYDKERTFYTAKKNLIELGDKIIQASEHLYSVYGDDFTLLCMLGSIESFYEAFLPSRMGRHYHHKFRIGGIAPAYHHLIAIEEGFAVHFSKGDSDGSPDIIVESLSHIAERAGTKLAEVEYNRDDVAVRLLARNRALLIYSGKVCFDHYQLFANNCEHFATLCKTGRSRSGQVQSFFVDAMVAGLSVIANRPQLAAMVIAKRFR